MEQKINRLAGILQAEYGLLWVASIALAALYEYNVLPQGMLVGDARAGYIMQVACILLTVCLIPLSLRMFSLSLTRHVSTLPLKEALKSYRRWSEVRTALLLVAALINLSAYYWTLDSTGLLCAGMVFIASLFCVPSKKRLLDELHLSNSTLSE